MASLGLGIPETKPKPVKSWRVERGTRGPDVLVLSPYAPEITKRGGVIFYGLDGNVLEYFAEATFEAVRFVEEVSHG